MIGKREKMKISNSNSEIENWKKEIQSEDWTVALNAANNLGNIGGDNIINFLIKLLESDHVSIRNAAALSIRATKDSRAIEPLLKSIFEPNNREYNGTMVYALQALECKNQLVALFKILFYESYECKMGAYLILDEQIFKFNQEDLIKIQKMWNECNEQPNIAIGFDDDETLLMMKDAYDGFMEYLNKNDKPSS